MVASGLVDNLSVTHLDLSHNRVADRGVRALAKLLDSRSVLAFLDLCDNQIHTEGGRALARALRGNHSLLSLNLRLNRIGDDGGRAICDVLRVRALVPSLIHPVCFRTDFSNGMKEVQQKGMDIYFFTSSHPAVASHSSQKRGARRSSSAARCPSPYPPRLAATGWLQNRRE
jgi:hypothetical protein